MKALIIEDELASARNLQHILKNIGEVEVLEVLDSIEDSVQWFQENAPPDVLFLDIHLADGSSFRIFDQVEVTCPIIFTTAYDEHALDAFKVNSISYLLKPIKANELKEALTKLERLQQNKGWKKGIQEVKAIMAQEKHYRTHLLVSLSGNKLFPLKVDDILYFKIEEGLVKACTSENKKYYPDQTLDELTTMLDPYKFYRANRQFIIARKGIRDIDPWLNQRLAVNLTVPLEEPVIISKAKSSDFKAWLSGES